MEIIYNQLYILFSLRPPSGRALYMYAIENFTQDGETHKGAQQLLLCWDGDGVREKTNDLI